MAYASWGWRELAAAAAGCLRPAPQARQALCAALESLLGGSVTLWASGRAALDAAFRAIAAREPGRTAAWMPSLLCRSVAERAAAAGLRPRFYDIRPDLTPDLEQACAAMGPDSACLVAPHLYGRVAGLEQAAQRCRELGVWLIEDCAASLLLKGPNGRVSGLAGDLVILSFNTGKTLVAGGGGALIVRRPLPVAEPRRWPESGERTQALARVCFPLAWAWPSAGYTLLRDLPRRIWASLAPQSRTGLEMAAVDARIALIQWRRWPELERRRLQILAIYAAALGDLPGLRLPQYQPGVCVTRFFVEFPFNVNDRGRPRQPVRDLLHARGVQTHLPYAPLHLDPDFGPPQPGACPVTEAVASRCLALPSHPGLADGQVRYVCRVLREILCGSREWEAETPESGSAVPVIGGEE
ncbi:MAG: DegT/DnrJ/EryC1/StrS family aminotransferase [Bryobacteraceae bacterium]|nr:DegT/DnrJ/EryC1/StrS family aminotransferase [Bryobacteraceae bacterium]